jgi:hypothetical protein
MLKIQIKDLKVEQRVGKSAASGKTFNFRTQTGFTQLNGEVRKVPVSLEEDQPAYEVGMYTLGDGSFYFAQYGKLAIGRLELVKADPAQRAS